MDDKFSNDLFVLNFVQTVSSPLTHSKRLAVVRKMMKRCPKKLTINQWMQLWRGFYYVVWYEEMRKGGEEFIEEIGLIDNPSFLMSGFKSMAESWNGIDAFRIDKYMFLIRIMLRNVMKKQIEMISNDQLLFENTIFMKNYQKNKPNNEDFSEMKANVIDYILSVTSNTTGLIMHISDIYLKELKLIIEGMENLKNEEENKVTIYNEMLKPFIKWLALIKDERIIKSMETNIFINLIHEFILNQSIQMHTNLVRKILANFNLCLNFQNLPSINRKNNLIKMSELYKNKLEELEGKAETKVKRKIVLNKKGKRIKYELTTNTPYIRSIIPLPLN